MNFTHDDYTIAWVSALPLEMAAAKAMMDAVHPSLPQHKTDHNVYTLGKISGHNVVVACLPSGAYGSISAATVVSHLTSTFQNIRFGLMVGIGGGVPRNDPDIRLGDIVVSEPGPASSGVVQYDYGKTIRDGKLQRTGFLNKPPQVLLKAVSQMKSDCLHAKRMMNTIISDVQQKNKEMGEQYLRPENDWLFQPTYEHNGKEPSCSACDQNQLVVRPERTDNEPSVHYGLIASGDQVIKNAQTRDSIAEELGVLCFEMEAAGLMDELPSLVIRGICDYCDSHKHKQWQGYAAISAAAYAKSLLSSVPTLLPRKQPEESMLHLEPIKKTQLLSNFRRCIHRGGALMLRELVHHEPAGR
jgi:nucleoside phosphorylase